MSEEPTRAPKVHELKVWRRFYPDLRSGVKTFELRKDDRPEGYLVGDFLRLQEYDEEKEQYTGAEYVVRVTYKLDKAPELGLATGFCILGIQNPRELVASPAVQFVRDYLEASAGSRAPMLKKL